MACFLSQYPKYNTHSVPVINLIWAIPLRTITKYGIYHQDRFLTTFWVSRVINNTKLELGWDFFQKRFFLTHPCRKSTEDNVFIWFRLLKYQKKSRPLIHPFLFCPQSQQYIETFYGVESKIYWRFAAVEFQILSHSVASIKRISSLFQVLESDLQGW